MLIVPASLTRTGGNRSAFYSDMYGLGGFGFTPLRHAADQVGRGDDRTFGRITTLSLHSITPYWVQMARNALGHVP